MRDADWQKIMLELLDGIEREFPEDTPLEIRNKFRILRDRIQNKKKSVSRRSVSEGIFNALEKIPSIEDSLGRFAVKKVADAEALLLRAKSVLQKYESKENGA